MLNDKTIAAIIPAKADSFRVPNKNMRPLGGLPLVERKIRQLQSCSLIDKVIVGSNSETIKDVCDRNGAIYLHRDEYFCDEARCSANEMIEDLVARVDCDIVLWAHCTNPFVEGIHYTEALETFLDSDGYDSLMSVTRLQSHLWTHEGVPYNFEPLRRPHQLASSLNPIYFQDGAIFIQSQAQMAENAYFYGERPYLFELPSLISMDINTIDDFRLAQWVVEGQERSSREEILPSCSDDTAR